MNIKDTICIDIPPCYLTNRSYAFVEENKRKKNMFIKMKKAVIKLFKHKKKLKYGV